MTYPFASAVQWIQRTVNDSGNAYSGTEYIEADPVDTTAVFAPGVSAEVTSGGDTVTTQPTLYGVDPALGVTALDVFVVGGDSYEVDGDPAAGWQSPFTGWQPNGGSSTVVALRKVEGVG